MAHWSWRRALVILLGAAAALTVTSEILVEALEPTVEALGVSKLFIGIIVIPLIGNLAEHVVGVTLAYKNKMDFSLITSIGSATQIALFATPILVFFSLIVGNPLTLVFTPARGRRGRGRRLHRVLHRARRTLELGRGAPADERLPHRGHRLLLRDLGR